MKKGILILLGLLMLSALVIAGCGSNDQQQSSTGYQDISTEQLKEMLDNEEDLMLVDVRESEEYQSGHIAGAILYPLGNIETWAQQLDKDQPMVMICRSGNRSAQAAKYLVEHGFTKVYNLTGGVTNWPYGLVEEIELPGNAA